MDDLISRQAAIDVAKEELDNGTYFDIPSKIKDLPSAQTERKRGKWMLSDIYESTHKAMLCNKCNAAYDMTIAGGMFNFCPNCGADMRGDQDEAD